MEELTPKQIKFMSELFKCSSITEAIKETGIAETTAYRWMREDTEFKKELQKRKEEILSSTVLMMNNHLSDAVQKLIKIINSEETSSQVSINAIDCLFRNYANLSKHTIIDIEKGNSEKMKRGSKETRISAYLRLAEMCGIDDEKERKEYMKKVSDLLEETEDVYAGDDHGNRKRI